MNERIRELAEQSGFGFGSYEFENEYDMACGSVSDLKKFAELIIQDCARVCDEIAEMAEITNTGEVARKTKATAVSCSNFIKNRFGVK